LYIAKLCPTKIVEHRCGCSVWFQLLLSYEKLDYIINTQEGAGNEHRTEKMGEVEILNYTTHIDLMEACLINLTGSITAFAPIHTTSTA